MSNESLNGMSNLLEMFFDEIYDYNLKTATLDWGCEARLMVRSE